MSGRRVIGPTRPPHLMSQATEDEDKPEEKYSVTERVRNRSRSPVSDRGNHKVSNVSLIQISLNIIEAVS